MTVEGSVLVVTGTHTPQWEESWETVRATPTPEQWRRFWSVVRSSGVHRWSADYGVGRGSHAMGWHLALASDGFARESRAWDLFPDARGRVAPGGQYTQEFAALMDAVDELTGGEFLKWSRWPADQQ